MPRNNFSWLLLGLLLILVGFPLLREATGVEGRIPLRVGLALALCIGVRTLVNDRRSFRIGVLLAVVAVLGTGTALGTGDATAIGAVAGSVTELAQLVFFLGGTWIVLRHLVVDRTVDRNKIVGAVCGYLLIGLGWAVAYQLLHRVDPASITGLDPDTDHAFEEFIYFSFVTLSTLGYGDLAPVSPAARSLATFEAVTGQFYIAVLVAALVGALVANRAAPAGDLRSPGEAPPAPPPSPAPDSRDP